MVLGNLGAAAGLGGVIIILIFVGLYFIPTIVAMTRKVTNVGSVFVINLLLGWTLVGWAVALAMAVKTNMTQIQVVTKSADAPPPFPVAGSVSSSQSVPPVTISSSSSSGSHSNVTQSPAEGSSKWCESCSKELAPESAFCSVCGTAAQEVNIYECLECKGPIELHDKFCRRCGASTD